MGLKRYPEPIHVRKRGPIAAMGIAALLAAVCLLFGNTAMPTSVQAAQVAAGDIIVVDSRAGTNSLGAVFQVDPSSGQRTLVSDLGNPAQGPLGKLAQAVAFDQVGLLVLDSMASPACSATGCGALFRVDLVTGNRQVLSDFGDAAKGPVGSRPQDLAVDSAGRILVTDPFAGLVFSVDGTTGARAIFSNFTDAARGPTGGRPWGIAVESSGRVVVTDTFPVPLLFALDPVTGGRTVITTFTNVSQGPTGVAPVDVRPEQGGQLLVLDQATFSPAGSGSGTLFRVDPNSGARTVVSDLTTPAQGPIGLTASSLDVAAGGQVLITDGDGGVDPARGVLFRVDALTGARSYLSDFGNPAQGPLGLEPIGLAIAPAQPPAQFTLTVVKTGAGSGRVTSDPAGIDCGTDCTETYVQGQPVTLNAVAESGSTFGGWGGDADCADGVVQVSANVQCEARFDLSVGKRRLPDLAWNRKETFLSSPTITTALLPYSLVVGYWVENIGNATSPNTRLAFYLSSDRKLSLDDLSLGTYETVPSLPSGAEIGALIFGGVIPAGTPVGNYYIIGVVDPGNVVAELREQNNEIILRFEICQGITVCD